MNEASRIGAAREEFTADRMKQRGYRILARNYQTRYGELDIIAASPRYIVFVEVKTRLPGSLAEPETFVTPSKQKKLVRAALLYLQKYPSDLQPRFDVAGVTMDTAGCVREFHYLANAFSGKELF